MLHSLFPKICRNSAAFELLTYKYTAASVSETVLRPAPGDFPAAGFSSPPGRPGRHDLYGAARSTGSGRLGPVNMTWMTRPGWRDRSAEFGQRGSADTTCMARPGLHGLVYTARMARPGLHGPVYTARTARSIYLARTTQLHSVLISADLLYHTTEKR